MNRHAALLLLAVFIAFATARSSASAPASTSIDSKAHASALKTQSHNPTPVAASTAGPTNSDHFFKVNDAKGLVLTCIAPEIETNVDTDIFKDCTLAPGRTLDEVMHIFIQGIHYEQGQHEKEREAWQRDLEEEASQRHAQK